MRVLPADMCALLLTKHDRNNERGVKGPYVSVLKALIKIMCSYALTDFDFKAFSWSGTLTCLCNFTASS